MHGINIKEEYTSPLLNSFLLPSYHPSQNFSKNTDRRMKNVYGKGNWELVNFLL